MAEIIQFPTDSIKSENEFKELLGEILILPDDVDLEKWESIAIPNIYKLLQLPEFNKSFETGKMSDIEADILKHDLTKAFKEYGRAVQEPLIIEIAKLYIELCKSHNK